MFKSIYANDPQILSVINGAAVLTLTEEFSSFPDP